MYRPIKILLLASFCVALMCSLAWLGFARWSATDYGFDFHAAEVQSNVRIVFDDFAVPHIYADSEVDAMFALGYVHASERLWQMDLLRRAGGGELSELLGPDMVENDTYLRSLGMKAAAERDAEAFNTTAPPDQVAAAQAYMNGINRFIDRGRKPVEYRLLGAEPTPFSIQDMYKATGFMAYSFAIPLKNEPIMDWIKVHFDAEHLDVFAFDTEGYTKIPVGQHSAAHSSRPAVAVDATGLATMVEALDAVRPVPQWLGSNAWVIGGDKTASGEVVFANDAHMAYAAPCVWYEAHVVTPELDYYGNHIGGIPFPALGHTRDHAWGITMFVNDDMDLYSETIKDGQYLHDGQWLDLEVSTEIIHVKGEEDVSFELRKTHHGPIIFDDVAMWWTYTQYPENRLQEAFYGFSRSENLEQMQAAASLVHAPGINVMYGDKQGNIAWWASAKLPVRSDSVDCQALIDGTQSTNDIQGWHDFSMNPQLVNPEKGYVFSANNAPQSVQGVDYPGHYYAGNTRAAQIIEALSTEKSDWTVRDVQALQLRNNSPVYARNNALLVKYADVNGELEALDAVDEPFSELLAEAFKGMRNWQGEHEMHDYRPMIYYRWMYQTIKGVFADEMGQEKFDIFVKTIVSENTFPRLLDRPDSPWWDDVKTERAEAPGEIVRAAFLAAIDEVTASQGAGLESWSYGAVHTVTHKHAMGEVKPLDRLFNVGPFSVPAAKDALNKYEFKLTESVECDVFSGPSMRVGLDFADVENSESILPTGQSGNVFSRFYDDQAMLYHRGQFRKQRMDAADIKAHQTGASIIRKAAGDAPQ